MPGEGSIVRGNRRLPESPNTLQIQEMCEDPLHQNFNTVFLVFINRHMKQNNSITQQKCNKK